MAIVEDPQILALERQNRALRWLHLAGRKLVGPRRLDALMQTVLGTGLSTLGATRGFLFLCAQEDLLGALYAGRGFLELKDLSAADLNRTQVRCLIEEILAAREGYEVDAPVEPEAGKPYRVNGYTLRADERVFGVLYLDRPAHKLVPREIDPETFAAYIEQASAILGGMLDFEDAVRDGLTGGYAHSHFVRRLDEELRKARRYDRPAALLMIGLDHFRIINEMKGRAAGDQALRAIAALLSRQARDVDFVGRFTSDIFEVGLPETDAAGALVIAQRMRAAIEGQSIPIVAVRSLTASIGLAAFPSDAESAADLVQAGMELLAKAKEERNRVVARSQPGPAAARPARGRGADFLSLSNQASTLIKTMGSIGNVELDLARLVEHILSRGVELSGARRAALALADEDGQIDLAHIHFLKGGQASYKGFKLPPGLLEDVARSRQVRDIRGDGAVWPRGYLCLPLALLPAGVPPSPGTSAAGRLLGVVYLEAGEGQSAPFDAQAREAVKTLLQRLALPLEGARMIQSQVEELTQVKQVLAESLEQLRARYSYGSIIGKSRAMRGVFELLRKIVKSDYPVIIQGESGTGKELVARAIHYNGERRAHPFVAENCAALSDSLLEAELFGYRSGAFTGALRDKKGLFELATGGTLFLDEVGDMSLNMQKKLLRALEEGSIRPLGAKEKIAISVRILCATNQNLRALVEEGRFREDLYYRLNVVTVVVPALRERREDIPLLVDYFLDAVARRTGSPRKALAREALAVFMEYEWPGNVRELENVVKNLCLMTEEVEIDAHLLGSLLRPEAQGGSSPAKVAEGLDLERLDYAQLLQLLADLERDYLKRTLEKAAGNKSRAAQTLGLTRPALYRSLKRLGLEA